MPQANIFTVLAPLISGIVSGIIVALLNFFFTRRKTAAEIENLKANTAKIMQELGGISSAVTQIADSAQKIIYDGKGKDAGFDFQGVEERLYNAKSQPLSDYGRGNLVFDNDGVLNVSRTNTVGRYTILLKSYYFNGEKSTSISRNDLLSGDRRFRVKFETKTVGAAHTLRVVLKNEQTGKWLDQKEQTISGNVWTPIRMYFAISPSEECRLRIDDFNVTEAPSSVQIRNFVLTESSVQSS